MSEASRGIPKWMGIVIIVLLLACLFLLLQKPAPVESETPPVGGPASVSDEVKQIITKDDMEYALVIGNDGQLAMISNQGKEVPNCVKQADPKEGKKQCSVYTDRKIKFDSLGTLVVNKIEYQFNPHCSVYFVTFGGQTYAFPDPLDPDCFP